jgi:hypothetical protein
LTNDKSMPNASGLKKKRFSLYVFECRTQNPNDFTTA